MKDKRKNQQTEKDYYSSVLLSQIICSVLILILFFCLKGSSKADMLENSYENLLEEDLLSQNINSAIASAENYFSGKGVSFAVSGNTVVPYAYEEAENTQEATASDNNEISNPVFLPEKVSEVSLDYTCEPEGLYIKKETAALAFPVSGGRFTSFFGEREDPIDGGDDYHKGVDIGADEGDRIKAFSDGVVSCVGEDSTAGKYMFITHSDRYETFYCHCSDILAEEGTVVRKGETIALVGSTGYSTGPHLHFEVRLDGKCIDPMPFLKNAV